MSNQPPLEPELTSGDHPASNEAAQDRPTTGEPDTSPGEQSVGSVPADADAQSESESDTSDLPVSDVNPTWGRWRRRH